MDSGKYRDIAEVWGKDPHLVDTAVLHARLGRGCMCLSQSDETKESVRLRQGLASGWRRAQDLSQRKSLTFRGSQGGGGMRLRLPQCHREDHLFINGPGPGEIRA